MYGITFVSIVCKDLKVSIGYVLILAFIDRAKRGKRNQNKPFFTGSSIEPSSSWLKANDWKNGVKSKGSQILFKLAGGSSQWGCTVCLFILLLYLMVFFVVYIIFVRQSRGADDG